ncbi:proline dehydrogenase [Colletotrichum graminicola]|uniref:Proline dehydrogenase n=1 Tax=Colletotrichum graminicola (strain M1.001 / M2 / FGSC 10212) TaxID=645133 RepID=E3Q8N6_COLGM|nr:proline dehydrogenase [Colletotrichum graminicola M1.001]EFQ27400.1 proline dehydrogenase [Colletotrichum graminicola M1.001]WDK13199.1 proline dehydrogenase [Colletotrichum graminicola]
MSARLVVSSQAPVPFCRSLRLQGATRYSSTAATTPAAKTQTLLSTTKKSPLSRLSTVSLVRSLALTQFMSSPLLMKPALPLLHFISKSKMALFNPDRNPVLKRLLRWTIYDHFCAGENLREVTKTVSDVKRMGYQGVILNYAKEIVLDAQEASAEGHAGDYAAPFYEMVDLWKKGNIETLHMLAPGDFLAVKITGAGPIAVDAMRARAPIPDVIRKALDEMCDEAKKQGSRLWIDAEQQALQPQLDEWTIDLMRHHNRNSKPLVYNTIQSYLKASKANAERHIALAAQEGWSLGVKLVRGAYIENEVRSLIHDTKEDTDRNFDDITDMFISQRLPEQAKGCEFPSSALFLATHNAASSATAITNHRRRLLEGQATTDLECGQLLGMADELSCELLDNYDSCLTDSGLKRDAIPKPFKYLPWGTVSECMGYLHRRAVENKGAIEQSSHMLGSLKSELRRRVFG